MKNKKILFIIVCVILLLCAVFVFLPKDKKDLDGKVVKTSEINLDDYQENIILNSKKEYTLSGNFRNTIIIDSKEDVVLNLNNVRIETRNVIPIVNLQNNKLAINISSREENTISNKGRNEYNSCIFSNGDIVINGEGVLNIENEYTDGKGITSKGNLIEINNGEIYIKTKDDGVFAESEKSNVKINGGDIYIVGGTDAIDSNNKIEINGGNLYALGSNENKQAGLETNNGYTINGGTVIMLGSSSSELPLDTSKQKVMYFKMDSDFNEQTNLILTNDKKESIISFKVPNEFRVMVISSEKIMDGNYYLYKDNIDKENNKISINKEETFKVNKTITKFGKKDRERTY